MFGCWTATKDVLKFRKVIKFESSCIVICFSDIYLFIDGKISFINPEIYAKYGKFNFFFWWRWLWSLELYRLAKSLAPIQTELFKFLSRLCTYFWNIHNLKNNSSLSRAGYLYRVNQKFSLTNAFVFFKIEGTSLKRDRKIINFPQYLH